jgi:hypothetical protein
MYSDWLQGGRPRGWSSNPGRAKNFQFFKLSRPALGPTLPPIQWAPGKGAIFLGVTRPVREADHSLPAIVEVKKTLYIHSPIRFHGVVLS